MNFTFVIDSSFLFKLELNLFDIILLFSNKNISPFAVPVIILFEFSRAWVSSTEGQSTIKWAKPRESWVRCCLTQ